MQVIKGKTQYIVYFKTKDKEKLQTTVSEIIDLFKSDCEDKENLKIYIDIQDSNDKYDKYTRYVIDIYSYDKSKHDKCAKKILEKYQEITTTIALSKLFKDNNELFKEIEVNQELFLPFKEFLDRFGEENNDELPENLVFYENIKICKQR